MNKLFPLYRFGGGGKATRNILPLVRKSSFFPSSLLIPQNIWVLIIALLMSTLLICLPFDHDQIMILYYLCFNNKNLEKVTIGVLSVIKNMFQKQKTKDASFFSWFYKLNELQHFLLVVFFKSSITEGFLI